MEFLMRETYVRGKNVFFCFPELYKSTSKSPCLLFKQNGDFSVIKKKKDCIFFFSVNRLEIYLVFTFFVFYINCSFLLFLDIFIRGKIVMQKAWFTKLLGIDPSVQV